jgi:cell wall-associated NlpC family hydrolase
MTKKLLAAPFVGLALIIALIVLLLGHSSGNAETFLRRPSTCTVPTGVAPAVADPGNQFGGVTLSPTQVSAAQTVLGVAKQMGITRRGATIAIQAAMQESTLNPAASNGHALGLFQQIAPGPNNAYAGYDPHDPAPAAKGFFTVLTARAPGYDRDPRPNHDLAEEVERSGQGGRYQRWQPFAEALTAALFLGTGPPLSCADQSVPGPIPITIRGPEVTLPPQAGTSGTIVAPSPPVAKAIGAGLAWLGTPYAWGGGDANGPTKGISDNGGAADQHGDVNKVGFDCAGLTAYAYAQAGVTLTRPSRTQLTNAQVVVPFTQAVPGDLLFWGTHHVALYLGTVGGQHLMLEAPQSGDVVKVSKVRTGGDFRGVAARPIPDGGDQA